MTDAEYELHIEGIIRLITRDSMAFTTPDQLAAEMVPGHAANQHLMRVIGKLTKITPRMLEAALERKRKETIKQEAVAAMAAKTLALVGANPTTEREFVEAFLDHGGYTVDYGGEFAAKDGKRSQKADLLRAMQLDAADLHLTKKPLELKDKNFERALEEWFITSRNERKDAIWRNISQISEGRDAAAVLGRFREICGLYFKEPEFACAMILKVLWQVKRKMQRLPIKEHHCIALYGAQDGGKTKFWSFIRGPVSDLCKEVAIDELVSAAQLDLYNYYLIEIPEMAGAERTEISKLKHILTAQHVSRRVYYTQSMQDVFMSATCVASTNFPLATLVKDTSGMRRLGQADIRPRYPDVAPYWDQIAGFDYLGLWQAVDHLGPDPLEPFMGLMMERQEGMRTRDRVEGWLDDFVFRPALMPHTKTNTAQILFTASDLFKAFQEYEAWAAPGQKMAFANWTLRMKALIDETRLPEWGYHVHGRRCVFNYTKDNILSLVAPAA